MLQEVLPFIGTCVFVSAGFFFFKYNNLTYSGSFVIRSAIDICMAKQLYAFKVSYIFLIEM